MTDEIPTNPKMAMNLAAAMSLRSAKEQEHVSAIYLENPELVERARQECLAAQEGYLDASEASARWIIQQFKK